MKVGVLIILVAMVVNIGLHSAVSAESLEVIDAFSRLDMLAEELAEEQRKLGILTGTPPSIEAPPNLVDRVGTTTQTDLTGAARSDREAVVQSAGSNGESTTCGSRQELSTTIGVLQERYDEHGRTIIAVNDELPMLRKMVLDVEHVCTERLAKHIDSALSGVDARDLAADYRIVEKLTGCVDRLRQATDEELSATASNIRMQRLAVEMEQLGLMTHLVADLERALLRGISKRERLVQELGQFQQEIKAVCR